MDRVTTLVLEGNIDRTFTLLFERKIDRTLTLIAEGKSTGRFPLDLGRKIDWRF